MSASDLPTELTVYVDPPRGEDADSLQGSISLVHSNRPTRVVLYDEDGDLPRVGRAGGRSAARLDELEEGETREYELHAEAGSRVVGLGARVETEAGDTVSSAQLHVLLNGSALSADAKAKFKASGALPPFDVPKECEVSQLSHPKNHTRVREGRREWGGGAVRMIPCLARTPLHMLTPTHLR
eukprot:2065600-Pleurochrysis_carterae.AAC.2